MQCTWDRVIDALRHRHDLSRVVKLALLGWRSKEAVAARDPRTSDHPMRDRGLDFG